MNPRYPNAGLLKAIKRMRRKDGEPVINAYPGTPRLEPKKGSKYMPHQGPRECCRRHLERQ